MVWLRCSVILLQITDDHFIFPQNAGSKSVPGMPEAGYLPSPGRLCAKGMVQISHARMSGTAFGTIVLYACPESAADGAGANM
ncbi:MAG: dihydroxy-acid dehydratase [Granulosicoccus sp.]